MQLLHHFSTTMKKTVPLLMLLALLWQGCTTTPVSVSTDYDRSANFTRYTTYKWYQDEPAAGRDTTRTYNTFLDKRMRTAVEANLARKGMRLVTSNPDLMVAYDMKVVTKQQVRPDYTFAPGFGYGYGYWYGYRYNYGYSRFGRPMMIDEYQDGTVIIDFVDARDNELIWRGWGQMTVGSANASEAEINKIVGEILEKYPPGAAR